MKPIFSKSTLISFFLIFASSTLSAQERGLDERINDAFTPIANWWEGLILHNFPGTEIPTIIFLLVGGALFFTFYFGFVNVRHFMTAINTVQGILTWPSRVILKALFQMKVRMEK